MNAKRGRYGRRLYLGAALLIGCVGSASAQGTAPTWEAGGFQLEPKLSVRARTEVVDWFDPGTSGVDASYTFFANVVHFGGVVRRDAFSVTLEGQEVELFDLPNDAPGLGPGAVYYANTRDTTQREVHLRRASLNWRVQEVPGLSVEGGRFVWNDGAETVPADPSLAWIKKARVSQRLIGGFEYTHVGRSFDGGVLRYDRKPWNLTVSGGLPTAGGFNISANQHLDELFVVYGAATWTEPLWLPRSDARLFYLYYDDTRDVVAVDNRPLAQRQADDDAIQVHTVGANFAQVWSAGPGEVDVLAWVAGQGGSWQSQDHAAWALALEAGYRLVDVYGKPWLRVGWFRGSGDDDPQDDDHTTFFQGLPTARLYAQSPFYNLMNSEDAFLQVLWGPWAGGNLQLEYHHLWAAEDRDLVYAGGGATVEKPLFGYSGIPASGEHDLADFVDVTLSHGFTPRLSATVYYGHAWGGAIVEDQYAGGDGLDYGFLEFTWNL